MTKPFYITTTIPYVNDKPHIGHALEVIKADALARYKRLMGYDVIFNFGTDEHGQKIWQKAQESGKDPQSYADEYSKTFVALKDVFHLSYDRFIRTTDPKHKAAAQEMWRRCKAAGDIYKKNYRVKYCVGCELEKTDSELVNGECPYHPGKPLEIRDEENYFFRLSRFQERLTALYAQQDLVVPDYRLNEIRSLIEHGGLQDFSISRLKTKMPWGIEVPDDPDHVMYVWFDALVNYISTLGWPQDEITFKKFWNGVSNIQIAGKDQVRQQACMWQAMLMSAGLPRTAKIYINGFITSGGQKMSKSLGNVVDPIAVAADYGAEALRYFVFRHIHPTEDSDFTLDRFAESYNASLVNGLGNLTARIMKLAEDNLTESKVPEPKPFPSEYTAAIELFDFNAAMEFIWKEVQRVDQKITETAPFKVIKTDPEKGKELISDLTQDLYGIARYLQPLMPQTSDIIKDAVKTNKKPENMFPRK